MLPMPKNFDPGRWVGQTLNAVRIQENLLQLDFGRTSSLINGQYNEYVRIDIEEGLLYQFGDVEKQFMQNSRPRRLCEAAEVLGVLISQNVRGVALLGEQRLQITFSNGARITLLTDELESYHIRSNVVSFSV